MWKRVGVGSKFERDALCLVSDAHEYIIRRPGAGTGAPNRVDPELHKLVGKDIRVNGTLNPSRSAVFVSDWEVLT
jgi:hypothetical protein